MKNATHKIYCLFEIDQDRERYRDYLCLTVESTKIASTINFGTHTTKS